MVRDHQWRASSDHRRDKLSECRGSRRTKLSDLRLFFFIACTLLALIVIFYSLELVQLCNSSIQQLEEAIIAGSPCSSVPATSICCDRTAFHTDVCYLRGGDVRTHSPSTSISLISASSEQQQIKPYPRKWETAIMDTIPTLNIVATTQQDTLPSCEVSHGLPATIFSTGGYTGNIYHDFNDGILPLYITTQHLNREVVFVILNYHNWWFTKYRDVLSRLSNYPLIDFTDDNRTHCFPAANVGLRVHGDLTISANAMVNNKTVADFRQLLDETYMPRIMSLQTMSPQQPLPIKPKLVLVLRNLSRVIENERELVELAEEVGFCVQLLRPERTTELAKIYRVLNSSDVMIGVHGAAMTHFMFMRPGAVFIQIVPLGTRWAAETYYGAPAERMGLWYLEYRIRPEESSLYGEYERDDPVLRDPEVVTAKGWEETKRVYLDRQNVRLDLVRFRRRLERARRYLLGKKRRRGQLISQE